MRIVQVVQHLRPGGLEVTALNLLEHTDADTHIISLDGNAETALRSWPRLAANADRIHFLDKPAGLNPGAILKLSGILRRLKPDVVHTHHIGPLLYGGLAARLARVKTLVHTEHDAWHLHEKRERRLQGFCLRLGRPLLAAVGSEVARALSGYFPWTKPKLIHNGIDTGRYCPQDPVAARQSMGLQEEGKWLGCAARLETVKGVDVLLNSFARLTESMSGLHLILAGQGSMLDELKALAITLGIDEQVHFMGHVEDMPAFYNACDVYCQPSRSEGLPLAPLEALACNRPCVLTDVGSCVDFSDIAGVVLVPAEDPAAFADALRAAIDSPAPDSRSAVESGFSVKVMAQQYLNLLRGELAS